MRISQLAERSGVPATTLRFYESAGLLPAGRTGAGYRNYGEDAVRRLAFIGGAKNLGLPLDEIAELLAVWESGPCAQVKADLRPRLAARLAEAETRAAELAAFMATLHGAQDHLDALPDRDEPCGPDCCPPQMPSARSATTSAVAANVESRGLEGDAPQVTAFKDAKPCGPECGTPEPAAERWRDAPVACTLSGAEMRERGADWHRLLAGAARTEIPDGLRLTLPADRAAALAELAVAEQECCAFFNFRLHLDGAEAHLEVRAPAAGAELLAEVFAV